MAQTKQARVRNGTFVNTTMKLILPSINTRVIWHIKNSLNTNYKALNIPNFPWICVHSSALVARLWTDLRNAHSVSSTGVLQAVTYILRLTILLAYLEPMKKECPCFNSRIMFHEQQCRHSNTCRTLARNHCYTCVICWQQSDLDDKQMLLAFVRTQAFFIWDSDFFVTVY